MHYTAPIFDQELAQDTFRSAKGHRLQPSTHFGTKLNAQMIGAHKPRIRNAMARHRECWCGMASTLWASSLQRIEKVLRRTFSAEGGVDHQ